MIFKNWDYTISLPNKTMSPFFIVFLIWSVIPSRLTPTFYIGGIPIGFSDIILLLICLPYLILLLAYKNFRIMPKSYTHALVFFAMAIYCSISLDDSVSIIINKTPAYFTILMFIGSFIFAYLFSIFSNSSNLYMKWLTTLLSMISALYLLQSLFSLGLRETAYTDFGIDRVKGPLFSSSTGQIILLPAIGYMLDRVIGKKEQKTFSLIVIFILISTILGLGSRSGLVSVAIFTILSILLTRKLKRKLFFIFVTIVISIPSFSLVFSRADITRLTNLEDGSRQENLNTSLQIFLSGSTEQKILGQGYSSVWDWYMIDKSSDNKFLNGNNLRTTDYGVLLYHPHSVFLFLIVELGILGTAIFAIIPILVLRKIMKNIVASRDIFLGISILSSFVSMGLDFFIFKNFLISSIWIIYFIFFMMPDRHFLDAGGKDESQYNS